MKVHSRLRRLEKKLDVGNKRWVIFNITSHGAAQEAENEKQRLIDDYLSKDNAPAGFYLFIKEIP